MRGENKERSKIKQRAERQRELLFQGTSAKMSLLVETRTRDLPNMLLRVVELTLCG